MSQGESRYGNPEPQIGMRFPAGTHHHTISAALHRLAADVELATPPRERWVVQLENCSTLHSVTGRVYLELADATPAEAERGRRAAPILRPIARRPP